LNFKERMKAVLRHEEPDQVPVGVHADLFPRGEFERKCREIGVGLVEVFAPYIWSEMPNVSVETRTQGNIETIIYHTPVGDVSCKRWSRKSCPRIGFPPIDYLFKDEADYDVLIYMIDDTIFHRRDEGYYDIVRDYGGDGIVTAGQESGITSPYANAWDYMGLQKWAIEQYRNPHDFDKLMKALERRVERLLPLLADGPAEIVHCGGISNFYGPKQFEKYDIPFYNKYLPLLQSKGKLCMVHAHSPNLKCLKDLIPKTGFDIIEAFTPPPVGDLSVAEASDAWGDDIIVWVNFPESIYYWGAEETKKYTLNLLKEGAQAFVYTEMATKGIIDEVTNRVFQEGFWAVAETVKKYRKNH